MMMMIRPSSTCSLFLTKLRRVTVMTTRMTASYSSSPSKSDNDKSVDRLKYSPEISAKDFKALVSKEMARQNVKTTDVPKETVFTHPKNHENSKRYLEAHGFAWFTCKKSHSSKNNYKRWPSAYAWCFIDIKKQKICYRDGQDCKKHNSRAKGPEFTEEALKRMAEYVVTKFLIQSGKKRLPKRKVTGTENTAGGPHDEKRCGKCQRLGRPCWK